MKNLLMTTIAIFGLATITFGQTVPSYLPSSGLIGWWPFNENANDESANSNDGTVNGASLTSDRFGNANASYNFNGTSDYIELALLTALNNQTQISISFWEYSDLLFDAQEGSVFSHWKTSSGIGAIGLNTRISSQGSFRCDMLNGVGVGSNNQIISSNVWNHVVFIYDGDNANLNQRCAIYVNNVFQGYFGSSNIPSASGSQSMRTVFGAQVAGSLYTFFKGRLDDIGIWNRALTQQEISNLNNASICSNNLTISPLINQLQTGSVANFIATTSDTFPSFVWQSDFGQGFQTLNNYGNYSGTNTSSLSISNVELPNHTQQVRVISTSGECIDTSNVATINITDTCIVTITDTITTLISVTDTLVINTLITGLTPPNNANTIKVFPNPANDHITIDFGNFASMNGYSLKITNAIGQTVYTTPINQQSSYLDLSTWGGNGIYFVQIIDSQNNTIENRKIVLQ